MTLNTSTHIGYKVEIAITSHWQTGINIKDDLLNFMRSQEYVEKSNWTIFVDTGYNINGINHDLYAIGFKVMPPNALIFELGLRFK